MQKIPCHRWFHMNNFFCLDLASSSTFYFSPVNLHKGFFYFYPLFTTAPSPLCTLMLLVETVSIKLCPITLIVCCFMSWQIFIHNDLSKKNSSIYEQKAFIFSAITKIWSQIYFLKLLVNCFIELVCAILSNVSSSKQSKHLYTLCK